MQKQQKNGTSCCRWFVCISEKDNNFSIIEVNSETDFVAKNNEFINFVEEVSRIIFSELEERLENLDIF